MLKIGIIGSGPSMAARIQQWEVVPHVVVTGYVLAAEEGQSVFAGTQQYDNADLLIEAVDIIDIFLDIPAQVQYIYKAIFFHKHLFIHNPFVIGITELLHIAKLIQEAKVKCQVGLYFRFQDSIQELARNRQPLKFMESVWHYKHTTVAQLYSWTEVVNNHIDLILHLLHSQVRKIYANGVMVHTDQKDIVSIRIQFDNGAVGTVVLNSCALKPVHNISLYGKTYASEIALLEHSSPEEGQIATVLINEALTSFISAVSQDSVIKVTIFDAINSVELSNEILKQIEA
ncbi:hypothetical protein DBR32_06545 [Taibaiella sp. KBW10]|uniref:hypothetical protein n=1 Tax=Taibaiella sp. KBW10 TaxID=2153357 RepID=UPI000F5B5EAA|nr:hypothetical protein [Taibaiella sp. KBW10]RQO31608.1 hypothetical protein DBR32_06545 [Taibaiella sp. KBW10]